MGSVQQTRGAYVLILSHALTGHITPMLAVAGALIERGWELGFLGPTRHRARIEAAGVEFFQLRGLADLDDLNLFARNPPVANYSQLPAHERTLLDTQVQTLDTIPDQWASIKDALGALHARDPQRQVVVVCEAFVYGILALKCGGAPLPAGVPEPRSLCVSVTPPIIRSAGLPPFGFPFPYDPSPAGPPMAAAMWQQWAQLAAPLTEHLDRKIVEAGGSRGTGVPFNTGSNYTCHEAILQIGLPSLEYPRSDWPKGFTFAGIAPPRVGGATAEEIKDVAWWDELVAAAAPSGDGEGGSRKKKTIVLVTQGTVEVDLTDLVVPTMRAVADLDDVLLVAILGTKGGSLPAGKGDTAAASNCRVVDYLRYGAVLPYVDLWVNNGGYGAVTQSIAAGIPMVVAGDGQDKPENARRVAWSGIGVNLDTARPTTEQVRQGVLEVLREGKYRDKVRAMQAEMAEWDFGEIFDREVRKLVIE